ncbi:putative transcription factor MADS-type1 family [Medicago truncatula]|uniref:MADS-box transcription factor family protein n=1 Tax=Medicago truncatula TaxID=3880 RepID=A0A072TZK6_MEDTR|nr:agamous-like MADS-box protein AGL62 [Medicago truncatula]KEH22919.1 MADS-box transcription factor family protein [Medicago truncatula]RHN46140.1 putative transcription factor MADS-type1 family [Medicago truncatula]
MFEKDKHILVFFKSNHNTGVRIYTHKKWLYNDSFAIQVTFLKHRSGLFKKVNELCTLCGVDVALVVFSPSKKVFSFGHPNVDMVIDRYLSGVPSQNNNTIEFIEAHRSTKVCELNAMLIQINNTLDEEKKCGDELSLSCKALKAQFWWAYPIDGMNKAQLELFKKMLVELKKLVNQHVDRSAIQGATAHTFPFSVGKDLSSNIPLHYQPNPQQIEMFSPQNFHNPMLQPHLIGFNNMGRGRYGPPGFY